MSDSFLRRAWARVPKPHQVLAWLARVWVWWRSFLRRTWARAPKPREVLAWLARLWAGLRAYIRDPEHRIMWGIILLAGVLRLGYLDLIQFGSEQARHLLGGLELVQNLNLPLIGIRTSSGVAQPPLMSYFLAIPLLLGRDPRIASAFVALLNVAAVAGCYLLARRYWGLRVAIVAAILFAVNPWAVVISRRVSAAGVLAPLATLEIWALCVALADGKPWGWVVAWVGLGLMVGLTLASLVMAAVLIILMLVYHRRLHWLYALLGFCLTLIIFLPYMYYQNAHRLEDLRALVRAFRQNVGAAPPFRALQYATRIHSSRQLSVLAGVSGGQFLPAGSALGWPPIVSIGGWLDWLSALTFLVSLFWVGALALGAWSHWRSKQDPVRFVVLSAWLWVPLLFWTLHSGPIEPHDLVLLYPAGFLAMGLLVDSILSWIKASSTRPFGWLPFMQIPVWLILVMLMAWQAYSVIYLYSFTAHHDTQSSYGTPYRSWRHIANLARRAAKDMGTNQVWVITQGTNPDQDEYPLLLSYLLGPQVKPVFLGQGGTNCMLLPAGRPGVYLLTRPSPPVERMLHYLQAEEKGVVFFPENKLEVRVWGLQAHEVEEMLNLVQHRGLWGWDSGLRLVGYDLPAAAKPGEVVTITGSWTFQDIPPQEYPTHHALFNYLVGADGTFAASRADLGLPERDWAEGLLLLQWVTLKLPETAPEGNYTLLMGMDRLSDSYRHRLIDGQGRDLGDAISLGPVRVAR